MSRKALDEILSEIARRDIRLYREGEKLKYRAPSGAVDEEIIEGIRSYKPQIMEMLSSGEESPEGGPGAPALTHAQERLWFLQKLEPGQTAYNIQALFRIEGELEIPLLRESLDRVLRRHEILRTRFEETEEGVRPLTESGIDFPLEITKVDPPALDRSLVDRLTAEDAGTAFDLSRAPLVRSRLIHDGRETHYLLLTMHHIITDGWSHAIFLREFTAIYRSLKTGETADLPQLPMQYGEYARRRRRKMSGAALEEELKRAARKLEGAPPFLKLPRDHPRPLRPSHRGRMIARTVAPDVTESFRSLCERLDASLYMGLFALFQLWLFRISGQDDMLTGTPVAGRTDTAAEELIGFFVNTLVVRTRPLRDRSFEELLADVREELLDVLQHQEVPFEKVVEELNPPRKPGCNPLFQVFFNMLSHEKNQVELPGATVTQLDLPETSTPFDLTLYATETGEALLLELLYAVDLFSEARAEEMLSQIVHLLGQVADDPARRLGAYTLLTPGAKTRIENARSAQEDGPLPESPPPLPEAIREAMARDPGSPAITGSGRTIDCGEVNRLTADLAGRLSGGGVTRLAIFAERSPKLPAAVAGALRAGLPFVILDASHPVPRHLRLLREIGADGLARCTESPLPDALEEYIDKNDIYLYDIQLDDINNKIYNDWSDPEGTSPVGRIAYWAATSGTTGTSRLIAGSRRPLDHFTAWYRKTFSVDAGDRFALLSGVAHDPLLRDILVPLSAGATLAVPSPELFQYPRKLYAWIGEREITSLHLTPALTQLMLDTAAEEGPSPLPAVKRVIFGGDRLTLPLLRRAAEAFPNARLFNGYGSTETPQLASCREVTSLAERGGGRNLLPVGSGIAGARLRVFTPEGRPAGVGEPGEVGVQSPHLSLGYWREEAIDDSHFLTGEGDPIYMTGDRGRLLPEGDVVVEGRLDRKFNLRGYLIDPLEIEECLMRHKSVERAVAWSDDGRLLGAWIPESPDAPLPERDMPGTLRDHLARHLPAHMIPDALLETGSFPLTANGKTDFQQLSERIRDRHGGRMAGDAGGSVREELRRPPGDEVERKLCEIWQSLTGRDHVGTGDDFFRIGGHSLLAARVNNRIRTEFGVELPLREHFERTTVRSLAEAVKSHDGQSAPTLDITPAEPREHYPLSHAQRRIWVLEKMDGASAAYSMPRSLLLRGTLKAEWIRKILSALAGEHRILRTTFAEREEGPVQVGDGCGGPLLREVDLEGAERPRAEAIRLAEEDAAAPFNLETGPLLRCTLIRLAPEEHVLLFNMHHIISDGWSMALIQKAFERGLNRIASGRDLSRGGLTGGEPGDSLQYADYAVWQQRFLESPRARELRGYWMDRFGDGIPVLDLPADRPRPPLKTYNGDRLAGTVGRDARSAIGELARRHECSRYVVLNALTTTLLHRYSGCDDFVVGTPSAGRLTSGLEDRIGCFVNMLPIRVQPEPGKPFGRYLQEVQSSVVAAYEHQAYPYDKLVDDLRPERRPERSPLFDVAVVYQDPDLREIDLPGLSAEPFLRADDTAKYDLTFTFEEGEGELALEIEYNTDLFDGERIRRMHAHFEALARAAGSGPGLPLSRLEMVRGTEKRKILSASRGPSPSFPEGTLHGLFSEQAKRDGDADALLFGDQSVSYRELEEQSDAIAGCLVRRNVKPGDRVTVEAQRNGSTVAAILGVLKAGGIYVPVDPDYPEARNRFIREDCGATCHLDAGEIAAAENGSPEDLPAHNPDPGRTAYIIYTSGSTGKPKGCRVTHRNVVRLIRNGEHPFAFRADDVWISTHSFCFDFSVWEMYGALLCGGTLVIADREESRNPEALHGLLREHRVTVLNQTPAAFYNLIESECRRQDRSLEHLRYVIFGGDRLDPALLEPWIERYDPRQTRLVNMYGITETTVHVTFGPLSEEEIRESRGGSPIGRPLPHTGLYVMDRHRQLLPRGVPGELYVGGEGVCLGYHDRPRLNTEKFPDDPFRPGERIYRTGDLGVMRFDGSFEYIGRNDRQVQLRGFRIEAGEIESVLAGDPRVRKTVVLSTGSDEGSKRLLAFCVPGNPDDPPAERELRSLLASHLPAYMIPARFLVVEEWPLTDNGKVDREALLERARERAASGGPEDGNGEHPPATALVRRIWQEVLPHPDPPPDTNFFDLGGNSLSLMKVHARLQEKMEGDLPVVDLFRHTTIRALARHLGETVSPREGETESHPNPPAS